jgi:F-type H+-transporting ATPase subunit b
MPQLEQLALAYASQLFWLGLVLAIIYFGVGHYMLPKIESTMDARSAKIAGDLAAAQSAQGEAEGMEEAWRKQMADAHSSAQAVIAKAKEKAGSNTASKIAKADEKINAQAETAYAGIEAAQKSAVAEVSKVAADSAQALVAKVAGLKVTSAAALKAVNEVAQ